MPTSRVNRYCIANRVGGNWPKWYSKTGNESGRFRNNTHAKCSGLKPLTQGAYFMSLKTKLFVLLLVFVFSTPGFTLAESVPQLAQKAGSSGLSVGMNLATGRLFAP